MTLAKKIAVQDRAEAAKAMIAPQWRTQIAVQDIDLIDPAAKYVSSVGIGSDLEPSPLLDLVLNHNFKHVCQEGNICFETELNTSSVMLLNPELFILKPLATILDPLNAVGAVEKDYQRWSLKFSKANEKVNALEEVSKVLSPVVRSVSLITDICSVMDELFTNAVFNAPFTNLHTLTNQNKDRSNRETSMPDPFQGEAFLGIDADRIIVGVRDPFGTLNLNSLFGKIRSCYTTGIEKNINQGQGGAGIGSYMVYSSSASYYAAIDKGLATIICCSIPLKLSNKARSVLPKNIHYTETST